MFSIGFLRNYYLFIIFAIVGTLYILCFNHRVVGTCNDDAMYIILAKSLISGQGYSNIYLKHNSPHTKYPLGLPVLISPFVYIFKNNYTPLKALSLLFTLGSILFLILINESQNLDSKNFLLILLFAINPIIVYESSLVVSEPAFLFFSLGTIYFFNKIIKVKHISKEIIIFLIFAVFTFFIRTVGVILFISFIVYLLYKRKIKNAIFIILLFCILLSIQVFINSKRGILSKGYESELWVSNPESESPQKENLTGMMKRFIYNSKEYLSTIIPDTLIPAFVSPQVVKLFNALKISILLKIIGISISIIVLIGFINRAKNEITVIEIYSLGILLICSIWPWRDGRFLLPIIPFLYLYLLEGLQKIFGLITKNERVIKNLIITFAIVILFFSMNRNKFTIQKSFVNGKDSYEIFEGVVDYINKNAGKNDIIMCSYQAPIYLYTERKTINIPNQKEINKIIEEIKSENPNYILIFPSLETAEWLGFGLTYIKPVLDSAQNKFQLVYQNDSKRVYLYKIIDK